MEIPSTVRSDAKARRDTLASDDAPNPDLIHPAAAICMSRRVPNVAEVPRHAVQPQPVDIGCGPS